MIRLTISRRLIDWKRELRKLRYVAPDRPPIREESLRPALDVSGAAALALSTWRGRSGRRYVVLFHALGSALAPIPGELSIRVRRGADGQASILGFGRIGLEGGDDANKLHIHRLAASDAERAAIRDRPDERAASPLQPVGADRGDRPRRRRAVRSAAPDALRHRGRG